jgi:hypothetical protein
MRVCLKATGQRAVTMKQNVVAAIIGTSEELKITEGGMYK